LCVDCWELSDIRVAGGIGVATAIIMSAQMVISVPRLPCSTLNSRQGTHQLATVSNSLQSTSLWLPRVGCLRGTICQLRERDSAGGAVKSTFTPYTEEIDSVGEDLPSCPVLFCVSHYQNLWIIRCENVEFLSHPSCCLILS
jgi:hypothetical protein